VTSIRQAYGFKAVLGNLRTGPMPRNSGYLALSTATMSVLGFLFWLLNARLFECQQNRRGDLSHLGDLADLLREPTWPQRENDRKSAKHGYSPAGFM
jgi:hypothetical protein